jgi:hypothetical protein
LTWKLPLRKGTRRKRTWSQFQQLSEEAAGELEQKNGEDDKIISIRGRRMIPPK